MEISGYQHLQMLTVDQFKYVLQEALKPFLNQMKDDITSFVKEDYQLVNIKVVMEKLQVTKPTIYNWINKGIIKREKIGGKVLFDLQAILVSIKDNNYRFGKGKDYLYKSFEDPKETKADRKYFNLNWKKMAKQPLSVEEENFMNAYDQLKKK